MENNSPEPAHYSIRWLAATLAGLLCITFSPDLFGGKTFLPSALVDTMTLPYMSEFGPAQDQNHFILDGIAQTFPYKVHTKEGVEKGKLAYWNPHILGGYPQYAETMGNNFDIFNLLLIWLDPLDSIHWQTVIELFIAGFGMILLLRFFGVSPVANLIFSTGYMLNSMFIATLANRWMVASFCWVPFIVLMILRYLNCGFKENILYASLFLALCFLGGNFQTSFFAVFIVTGVLLFYHLRNSQLSFIRRFGILIITGILAFALSAIMWLPSLGLLYQTLFHNGILNSSSINIEYSLADRLLSLPLLVSLFFPSLTGDAGTYSLKRIAGADPMDFNAAIGFLPILFGVIGCVMLWKKKQLRPFIMIAILGLLIPIATPLYYYLYHRFFIVAVFSLCIIGGVSFQLYIDDIGFRNSLVRVLKLTKFGLSLLISLLVGGWVYIILNYDTFLAKCTKYISQRVKSTAFASNESWTNGRVEKTLHYFSSLSPVLWLPILSAISIVITLSYYQKKKISSRNVLRIVMFMTVMELFVFARGWLPSIDTLQFPIYPANPISTYLQHDSSGGRFFVWRDPMLDPYILLRNGSTVYHTNDIDGYESLTCCSMLSLLNTGYRHVDTLNLRLLGLANVKYIITGKIILASADLHPLYSADSITIYENLLCKPRAYIAYSSKLVETDDAVAKKMLDQDFDGTTALFTKDDVPANVGNSRDGKNIIHFNRSDNEEVTITAQTESKGIFILTDTYYPGWKCYVNGVQRPIYRVNYCMRGVLLDAGTSTITFRFEPDIFTAGISISSIAAFVSLLYWLFLKRRHEIDPTSC